MRAWAIWAAVGLAGQACTGEIVRPLPKPAFSFELDGICHRSLPASWPTTTRVRTEEGRTTETTVARAPDGLEATLEITRYAQDPVVEWTLSFANAGKANSGRFTRISSGDLALPFASDAKLTLWRGIGEAYVKFPEKNYSFEYRPLTNGVTEALEAAEGYPSLMTFPYFRVFSPDSGYTVAVGWQGQWCGEVTRGMDGAVRVGARQQTVDFYLKPGERVISPTITVMAFGDHDDAVNAWRRFMRRWILPRAKDGKTPLRPILGINGQESGVLYNTITLDRQVELAKIMRGKGIDYDGWWVDAGWYVPKGATNAQGKAMTWYEGTGLWKPDPARFPPSGFKPLADELAKSGAMLFLWHEPERVHELSGFMEKAKPYLFPSSDTGMIRRYDMSRPDAVDFISGIVAESIVSNGVAFYRQDSNGPGPLRFWPHADQARGDGRKGIAENFAVQGQFRMWERFRAAKPGLYFDTCASGGRRNDLSTLRFPSVPLHYSDTGYWDFREKQHYNHMMNEWLFYRKNIAWAFHPPKSGKFIDRRHAVIDFAPMHMIRTVIFLDPDPRHEAEERQLLAIWRKCASLMIDGDYYLLTPETFGDDTWWVTQFHDAEIGRGFCQVVRNPANKDGSRTFRLKGVRAGARIVCEDLFSGLSYETDAGRPLSVTLPPDSATILHYSETAAKDRK